MNFGSCCLFLLPCLAVDMMWCTWDCTSFHKRLVCVLAWCMGAPTMTMFTPGPQTHHELRLKWLTQAQRTDSGGNWMAFIMSFRPQTLQKWAWMSWEIVLTKMGEFCSASHQLWESGVQISREFSEWFYPQQQKALYLGVCRLHQNLFAVSFDVHIVWVHYTLCTVCKLWPIWNSRMILSISHALVTS